MSSHYEKLAQILGISYDEAVELDPEVQERSNDDGDVSGYFIEFDKYSPQHIIKKITGIDEAGILHIDVEAGAGLS